MMAMARMYYRAKHQTAALVLFETGQPSLLVFGVRLGVFAGLHLSAVMPGLPLNWDRYLTISGLFATEDADRLTGLQTDGPTD